MCGKVKKHGEPFQRLTRSHGAMTLTPVDTICVRAGVTTDTPDVSGRDPAAQMEAEGRRGRSRRRRESDSEAAGQSVPSVGMKLRGPGSSGNAAVAAWSSQHSSSKKDGAMVACGDTQTAEKRCVHSWDHVISLSSPNKVSLVLSFCGKTVWSQLLKYRHEVTPSIKRLTK